MLPRHGRTRFLVLPCFLALVASAAWGGEIQILPESAPGVAPPSVTAACAVGETRPGVINLLFAPPEITHYTLLDPASCSTCTGGSLLLRAANFRVRTNIVVCTFSVEVTIIGAATGSACPLEPDPSVVLCGPVVADITSPSTATFTASVPLPGACCITRPAFLRIKVLSTGTCTSNRPAWSFTRGTCRLCSSFALVPDEPLNDLCALGLGNPVHWVDADCCDPTPSLRGTWGQLKTLYR